MHLCPTGKYKMPILNVSNFIIYERHKVILLASHSPNRKTTWNNLKLTKTPWSNQKQHTIQKQSKVPCSLYTSVIYVIIFFRRKSVLCLKFTLGHYGERIFLGFGSGDFRRFQVIEYFQVNFSPVDNEFNVFQWFYVVLDVVVSCFHSP